MLHNRWFLPSVLCNKVYSFHYSFLPNSLVSMLTNFIISSTDGDYIAMFSETNVFLVDLRLSIKVVFCTCVRF